MAERQTSLPFFGGKMKKVVFMFILFFIASFCFSKEFIKKYSYSETWYASSTAGGKSIYELKITSSPDNKTDEIQAELFHTMTPFPQIIWEDITLKRTKNKKYEFSFTDAWNNKAFGWIKFDSEGLELYMDCNDFDEIGKNFARLYGDTVKLHETTNDKDFLKKELYDSIQ